MADTKHSVWIALIGAAASIAVAFVTTKGTISSASPEIERATTQIEQLNRDLVEKERVVASLGNIEMLTPVGTVIASLIPPARFADLVGDPSVFDPKVSRWTLADRTRDVTLSRYGRLTNQSRTPDLRAMFLRGLDTGRGDGRGDPDGERIPGHIQFDEFREHSHPTVQMVGDNRVDGVDSTTRRSGDHHNQNKQTGKSGSAETRPQNAAVYYYLRIN